MTGISQTRKLIKQTIHEEILNVTVYQKTQLQTTGYHFKVFRILKSVRINMKHWQETQNGDTANKYQIRRKLAKSC